jgi:hypothetical protein
MMKRSGMAARDLITARKFQLVAYRKISVRGGWGEVGRGEHDVVCGTARAAPNRQEQECVRSQSQ